MCCHLGRHCRHVSRQANTFRLSFLLAGQANEPVRVPDTNSVVGALADPAVGILDLGHLAEDFVAASAGLFAPEANVALGAELTLLPQSVTRNAQGVGIDFAAGGPGLVLEDPIDLLSLAFSQQLLRDLLAAHGLCCSTQRTEGALDTMPASARDLFQTNAINVIAGKQKHLN